MATVTKTFGKKLLPNYIADSIIEIVHFRDMTFDADELAAFYLDTANAVVDVGSFNIGKIPDLDEVETDIEKSLAMTKAESLSNRVGLRFLTRKNNTGSWDEVAEFIILNFGRKDYLDLRGRLGYPAMLMEKNDALAVQMVDYGDGLLWDTDFIKINFGVTVQIEKKNNLDALTARISAIELAVQDRLIDLPGGTLLGRNTNTGTVEQIPMASFATPAQITTAINTLVGSSNTALNTLEELGAALANDSTFSATVTNSLAGKANLLNPTLVGSVRVGSSNLGSILITQGTTINSGYLGIYKGDGTTRLGYIGFDNVNFNYQSEGSAVHTFSGNRVDIFGGTIPPTASSRVSLFVSANNSYGSLISSTAPVNYKAYDWCNESGNFSIRRILDGYTGVAGDLLTHTTNNILSLGNAATRSAGLYGSITVNGTSGSYAGIHFSGAADGALFMLGAASRQGGVWSPSNGWQWFYNVGNFNVHSGGAVSEGSYIGLYKGLGALPGYPANRHPTVATDFGTLYFSIGGGYSATMNSNGVLTAVSDKNKKTVIEEIEGQETLAKISNLPVNRFHFKNEDSRITRIGTFAQDFYREFQCGGNQEIIDDDSPATPDKMLATSDVAGVCLAGIKGLIAEIDLLKAEIKMMQIIS